MRNGVHLNLFFVCFPSTNRFVKHKGMYSFKGVQHLTNVICDAYISSNEYDIFMNITFPVNWQLKFEEALQKCMHIHI